MRNILDMKDKTKYSRKSTYTGKADTNVIFFFLIPLKDKWLFKVNS